jgi:hypothetical protein
MRQKFAGRLGGLLSIVMLTAGLSTVTATTASAVGCVGASCYNKGPVAMGCTKDQRVIATADVPLYVYYSPACKAVWAISFDTISLGYPCATVQIEKSADAINVVQRLSQRLCPGETSDWTNMLATGGWYFRAIHDGSQGYPTWYTNWVVR